MADLVVAEVTKQYATRAEPLDVLRGASLELQAGRSLAVLGPSGCGKSTLLHILGTLDSPTSGSVALAGQNPFLLDEPHVAAFRNRHIGFVFQDHHLLPQCSVLENVLLPAMADGKPDQAAILRAHHLIRQVGLAERLDHRPAELSGGERQRAAVARALVNGPTLLLADEPTGNLDRATAAVIGQLLLDMQRSAGAMLIVVTHSLQLARLMDRQLVLSEGRLQDADRAETHDALSR